MTDGRRFSLLKLKQYISYISRITWISKTHYRITTNKPSIIIQDYCIIKCRPLPACRNCFMLEYLKTFHHFISISLLYTRSTISNMYLGREHLVMIILFIIDGSFFIMSKLLQFPICHPHYCHYMLIILTWLYNIFMGMRHDFQHSSQRLPQDFLIWE